MSESNSDQEKSDQEASDYHYYFPLQFISEDILFPDHTENTVERRASRNLLEISLQTSFESCNWLDDFSSFEEFNYLKHNNNVPSSSEHVKLTRTKSKDFYFGGSKNNSTFSYSHSDSTSHGNSLYQNYKSSIENCLRSRSKTYFDGFPNNSQNVHLSHASGIFLNRSHTFQVLEKVPEHSEELFASEREISKELSYNQIFLEMIPSFGTSQAKVGYVSNSKSSDYTCRKQEIFGAKRSTNQRSEIELPILSSNSQTRPRANSFFIDRKPSRNRREIERQKAVLLANLEQKLKSLNEREYDRLFQHESYASLLPQIDAESPFFTVPKKEHLLSSTIEQRQKLKEREKDSIRESPQPLTTCENVSTWLVTTTQSQARQNAKVPSIIKIKFNNMRNSKHGAKKGGSSSMGTGDLSLITSNLTRALTHISGNGGSSQQQHKKLMHQQSLDQGFKTAQDLSTISQIEYTRAYLQELGKK